MIPVIIVLYHPGTGECIWKYISEVKDNNKIKIARSHTFDETAKDELIKIANLEPYKIAQIQRRLYIEENGALKILQDQMRTQAEDEKTAVKTAKKAECCGYMDGIAIDFATTQTMVMILSTEGKHTVIKSPEGKNYFETVVGFDCNYQYYIGADALKRKEDPSFTLIRHFKRELGLNKKYQILGLTFSAEDITTLFLQSMICYIESKYGITVRQCYISEPVDFSYLQKRAYIECIEKMRYIRQTSDC